MISKYSYKKLVWIDLESPTKEEIHALCEAYNLPTLVGEELLTETLRAKVDRYDNALYMILRFPRLKGKHGNKGDEQEVDFVIGKDFIITAHYEKIQSLHEFSKLFEVDSSLDKSFVGNHAGYLLYYIIRELYKHAILELEDVNVSLKKIEEDIFRGREAAMVVAISNVNRVLVDFKQALRFHGDTLRSFEAAGAQFFGTDFSFYLGSIIAEYNKVENILDGHREIIDDLRKTNDSLLTHKTNETMRTLTMMSFVVFPLTLIAGIFGMNADLPIVSGPNDFTIILGIMVIAALSMLLFFKHKRWL